MEDVEDERELSSRCASVNLYRCSEVGCDKTFSRPSRLQTHLLSHSGERPFQCDLCDKDFTRNAHLKRHVQVNHEGLKSSSEVSKREFHCDKCNTNYANKHSLKKHVKSFHEVKQYQCTECDKTFHKHHMLRSHLAEHSGLNPGLPHKCDQCGKTFPYSMYLKRHLRKHKGYSCNICKDTFEKWTDLQQHKNAAHTSDPTPGQVTLACDQCDKMFPTETILKRHIMIHTETRPVFHCPREFCPRYFYFKNNLSHHLKSYHTGLKHLCSQSGCNQKFSTRQKLLNHLENIHHQDEDCDRPRVKKKPSRPRNIRKDRGKFKKPMLSVLTGLDLHQEGVESLLRDEAKCLDKLDNISREIKEFVENSSEAASDAEVFVGCNRKAGIGRLENQSPFLLGRQDAKSPFLLGTLRRIEQDRHFKRVRVEESESDTDMETNLNIANTTVHPIKDKKVDFSRFLLK